MKNSSVLIVGCGDIGIRTGATLLQLGWDVAGVRRDSSKLPATFTGYDANYTQAASLDFIAVLKPDFVIATFTPSERSIEGYKAGFEFAMQNLLAGLGHHQPQHILMVSSTRVFAESCGGWVDESSPLTQDDPSAQAIIEAEQLLLRSGHSASVVRFAGIYGIPGGRLLSRIRSGELCASEPVSYTNRIHREDCAGFLVHLLQLRRAGHTIAPIYIGVDDLPAPRYAVESWLAGELGLDIPPQDLSDAADQSTVHTKVSHKRCKNVALRESGYELIYPDYQSGYRALLDLS